MAPATSAPLPALGAPGVYLAPDAAGRPPLPVRMDVCAFVGVAPRGPAWERADGPAVDRARSVAVPVQSWQEYEEVFGGYAGPGLLPHAVAAFFAQGGSRAYIVRIVPREPVPTQDAQVPPARAVLTFASGVTDGNGAALRLQARNEGRWGALLTATLTFGVVAMPVPGLDGRTLVLTPGTTVTAGSLLRLRPRGGTDELRLVTGVMRRPARAGTGWELLAALDAPVTGPLERAEEVTAVLDVVDGDPGRARSERFTDLGLTSGHPRWLGAALSTGSRLVEPMPSTEAVLPADSRLAPALATVTTCGTDRYVFLTPEDFFGAPLADPEAPPGGLDALRDLPDCATVVVPDLYAPAEPPAAESVSTPATLAGADFAPCVPVPGSGPTRRPPTDLPGLRCDPLDRGERAVVVALQQRVVAFAERENMVALLDVPPGLRPRDVLSWRSAFDSSYAAAYHGWPRVPDPRVNRLVTVAPAPYAAGTLAAAEHARGTPFGPAQAPLAGVVDVAEGPGRRTGSGPADPEALGTLHRAGINVCVLGRSGARITAARTLARDPASGQLTARRTVSYLERTLEQQLAWAAFEPNDALLRDRVRVAVEHLLLDLFAAGAFAGGSPADSFFVRVPAAGTAAGTATGGADLLCEIGVAPGTPLEFLVVRVLRMDDGTLRTEGGR
ncbi:phage tail sheath family protein [Streptomyces tagetis]|uniref:Phage tail sheath family protein n=1 Tax=Streptomyces tagetis TaxID=2820809 RepID=A0A940XE80_9ACTN|nr:phage tail sheath family protein [Streptomyces sp. RG38]MBQ0826636.1 phage tail sheath family protein [Streptomyces sp. RG38]